LLPAALFLAARLLASPAPTLPSTLPTSPDPLQALIADLAGDSWLVRQKAQDALVKLGPDIRPRLLRLLRETQDEEVRTRLEAALRRIDEDRATGVSLVTVRLRNASPPQIFAELSRQANAPLLPDPPGLFESRDWPALDLDIQSQPFWAAMRQISARLSVTLQPAGPQQELAVVDRSPGARMLAGSPACLAGPFLVVATQINTYRSVDLNQPKNVRRHCSLALLVYAEPKLRLLQGSNTASIEEATDDLGNSLVVSPAPADYMQPGNHWLWNLNVSLAPPPQGPRRIATLKGSARYLIQTRSDAARIPDVLNARNVPRTVAGMRFLFKDLRRRGDFYEARLDIHRPGLNPNDWNLPNLYNSFKLLDSRGNPFIRLGSVSPAPAADVTEITLQFQRRNLPNQPPAEPATLLWEVPTETSLVVVPFRFSDLPLP
jgi:hypothetical protein